MWTWETEAPAKGVIVIVHGASEHHGRYEWLRNQWLSAHYHVIQGDLPGQGEKTKRRGHIDHFDQYIEVISSWIVAAKEYDLPVFILGHSLGGLGVIRTLQEKQLTLNGVILSSPSLGLVIPPPKALVAIANLIDKVKPDFLFRVKKSPVNHNATRNSEILNRDALDPWIVKKVSARWYLELEKAMQLAFDEVTRFPDVPLLILQAGHDKIVDKHVVKKWYDLLQSSQSVYKEWDGLYHEVFNEPERDLVFKDAQQFISQLM